MIPIVDVVGLAPTLSTLVADGAALTVSDDDTVVAAESASFLIGTESPVPIESVICDDRVDDVDVEIKSRTLIATAVKIASMASTSKI